VQRGRVLRRDAGRGRERRGPAPRRHVQQPQREQLARAGGGGAARPERPLGVSVARVAGPRARRRQGALQRQRQEARDRAQAEAARVCCTTFFWHQVEEWDIFGFDQV